MARVSISLKGIDQAIAGLNYKKNSIKEKILMAIRSHYLSEDSIAELESINTDDIVKSVWDTGSSPIKIRAKRRNFSSIKSSINADLKKLSKKNQNPENITINSVNIFDMSEDAKNDLLKSFANSVKTGEVDLNQVSELLKVVTDFLSDAHDIPGNETFQDIISQVKEIISKVSQNMLPDTEGENQGTGDTEPGNDKSQSGEIESSGTEETTFEEDIEEVDFNEDEDFEEIDLDEDEDIEEVELNANETLGEIDENEDLEEIDELNEDEDFEEIEDVPEEDTEEVELDEDEEIEDVDTSEDDTEEIELDEDEDIEEVELDEDEEIEDVELDEDEKIEEVDLEEDETLEEVDETDDLEEIDELNEDEGFEEIEDVPEEDTEEVEVDEDEEIEEIDTSEDDTEEIELDEDEDIEEVELDEDEEIEDVELDEDEKIEEVELDGDEEIEEVDLEEDETLEEVDLDEDLEEIDELDEDEELEEIDELDEDEELEEIDELDEDEIQALENYKKEKELAEHFDQFIGNSDKKYNAYVLIPAGTYTVGSKRNFKMTLKLQEIDMPEVYIARYPVTNALFEIFVEHTGYITLAEKKGFGTVFHGRFKRGKKTSLWKKTSGSTTVAGACWYQPQGPGSTLHGKKYHPVVQIGMEDAWAFASWIGRRLPSEAEWEACARTDMSLRYPWGNEWKNGCCNIETSSFSDTTPVDKYDNYANEFKISDLLGNIMEWTSDKEQALLNSNNTIMFNIAKGGGWTAKDDITITSRSLFKPGFTSNITGFRCISEKFL